MVLDFSWLPPEINSARIFAGAGSGPLFVAASAWEALASDLSGAASSFDSVVTGLTGGPWTGPSSTAMAEAATPYVGWLNSAAGQAAAAAGQARAAATAFESALAATVPPAAVAANRTQLMELIAANILGQNTPAIFMTEFEYMEMWAQDVAAMLGYHGGAIAAAAGLPSFSLPPLNLGSLAGLMTPALAGVGSEVAGLASSVGATLAAPLAPVVAPAVSQVSALASAVPLSSVQQVAQMVMYPASMAMSPIMMAAQAGMSAHPAALASATDAGAGAPKFVSAAAPGTKGLGGAGMGGLGGASADLGKARLVGAMSVPPTWQGSTPARMVSAAMSGLGAEGPAAAAGAPMGGSGMMPMPMPMGGMGAGMPGGMMGRGGASPNVVQSRPSVVPRVGVG